MSRQSLKRQGGVLGGPTSNAVLWKPRKSAGAAEEGGVGFIGSQISREGGISPRLNITQPISSSKFEF